MPTRCLAFIYTARSLPLFSILSRAHVARPHMTRLNQWAARRAETYTGDEVEATRRLDGWALGSDEFRRSYKIEADDAQAAAWVLTPAMQQRLLVDSNVSICSIGADILAWCDRGFGGEGFDITLIGELLAILDTIELPHQRSPAS